MSKYEITPLNSNKTILQIVKGIEKYLHDNQIYKVFGYNGNYDAETELYSIDDLYTEEQLKADDVVLFNNCYLGIVDAVGTNSFSVKDVINFRGEKGDTGATGEKGEKGDKGDTGETGATGQTGATGNGIASIVKTGTSGLVDTYTITFTDGSTFTYNVTNGAKGEDGSGVTTYTGGISDLIGYTKELPYNNLVGGTITITEGYAYCYATSRNIKTGASSTTELFNAKAFSNLEIKTKDYCAIPRDDQTSPIIYNQFYNGKIVNVEGILKAFELTRIDNHIIYECYLEGTLRMGQTTSPTTYRPFIEIKCFDRQSDLDITLFIVLSTSSTYSTINGFGTSQISGSVTTKRLN